MKKLLLIFLFPIILQAQLNGLLGLLSKSTEITYADTARSFNYYVDNTGTGDTLSTIAEVSALSLQGLDTVFFKRGCEWREQLTVPSSGIEGYPIVFTSYGSGSKPVLDASENYNTNNWIADSSYGSDLLSGWNFTSGWTPNGTTTIDDNNSFTVPGAAGGIYKVLLTSGRKYKVVIAGSSTGNFDLKDLASKLLSADFGTVEFIATNTGLFLYSTTGTTDITTFTLQLYGLSTTIWKMDNPLANINQLVIAVDDTLYSAVETKAELAPYKYYVDVSASPDMIYLYSASDPDTRDVKISTREYGIKLEAKQYITIQNLECKFGFYAGIRGVNAQANSNIIIDSCTTNYNYQAGIQFYNGYNNAIIRNCVAEYNGNGFYANIADSISFINNIARNNIVKQAPIYNAHADGHGIGVFDGNDCLAEYNICSGNYGNIIFDANTNPYNLTVRYNRCDSTQGGTSALIAGNITTGGEANFYYNVCYANGDAGTGGNAFGVNEESTGNINFYNNTIYQPDGIGTGGILLVNGNNVTLKNNIIFNNRNAGWVLYVGTGSPTIDYNVYYSPTDATPFRYGATDYANISTWVTATSLDSNSVEDNPDFTTLGSDFTLQTGSPAINAGTDVGLTTDILGNPIVGNPDIGAYEKQ